MTGLNGGGRARILCEISLEEHGELVREAAVYAMSLKEGARSAGQVRLGNCNEAGTPAVITWVRGLEGYLLDGVNAIAVPQGDFAAMRSAIDGLMSSPEKRRALAATALEDSYRSTRADFFAEFRRVLGALCSGERDVRSADYRRPRKDATRGA